VGTRAHQLPLPLRKSASFACVAIVVATQYGIRGGVFEMASCGLIAMLVMLRAEKSRIRFTQVRVPPPTD
jgi:NADH:ubiquinone oxidoreductase subunit 4 (subunit M)